MTSKPLEWYLNNDFPTSGFFEMPRIEAQPISLDNLKLIRFSSTVKSENKDRDATVHFFEPDDRFDEVWNNPPKYLDELRQYKQVLSPDFSLYVNAPLSAQLINTYRSRWCGRFWQENGLIVIPTVSWSSTRSFEFCFDGLPEQAILAVSTLGVRDHEELFMNGFRYMLRRLIPLEIICYGEPFDSMMDLVPITKVPYSRNSRVIDKVT